MLAMFHFKDRKDNGSKRYWDWVASYAMSFGLLGLILQPLLGQLYMNSILASNPTAFQFIMHGPRAWAMLMMLVLLIGLFISIIVYFMDRREIIISKMETLLLNKMFKVFLIVAVIAGIFLLIPSWLGKVPFVDDPAAYVIFAGNMDLKYVLLGLFTIIGAVILTLDFLFIGDIGETEWGKLSNGARYAAILAGILATAIIPVMGYVREGGRAPWTVFNIVPVPGGTGFLQFQTPIPPYQIVVVWTGIITLTIAIWWFVFRITAHHPEKKEEIDEPAELPEPTKRLD